MSKIKRTVCYTFIYNEARILEILTAIFNRAINSGNPNGYHLIRSANRAPSGLISI